MDDFYSQFNAAVSDENISEANATLMKELGKILVLNKSDFIDMLNKAGIETSEDQGESELIELFVNNAPNNKKLLLGASLLINFHNRKTGFDGEEEIDDDGVKKGYFIMSSCFCDNEEERSNFIPFGLIARGAKKGIDAIRERRTAKDKMQEEAIKRKEEERKRREVMREKQQKKERNILLFGGIAIIGLIAVGVIVMRKR